jgi:predicted ABC-type ATPase
VNDAPGIIILAGSNGSGKTTAARWLLAEELGVMEFVNAVVIAQGLSGFSPESVAVEAGRIMLMRLKELAGARVTLAASGYLIKLNYFWLPSPELSFARVQNRVRKGGHFIAPETVNRRYYRGLNNFFELYRPISNVWRMWDNSSPYGPRIDDEPVARLECELRALPPDKLLLAAA